MTTPYTGIFLRDSLDQTPNQSTPTWTTSPDIFRYANLGPDNFGYLLAQGQDDYGESWNTGNAVYSSGNDYYVRGLYYANDKIKNLTALGPLVRVYLFYAQPDEMNKPANWKSAGLVGFDIDHGASLSSNCIDVPIQPYTSSSADASSTGTGIVACFRWTPPPINSSQKPYRLIAWVQNVDSAFDPSTLPPDLGDDAAMCTFFNNHPNMACFDTAPTYGIFVRDAVNQASYQTSPAPMSSPDVIITGTAPSSAPGSLILPASYGAAPPEQSATINMWNHIYIRGKNIGTGSQRAVIWLFYADSSIGQLQYPDNWKADNFVCQGKEQNWAEVTANQQGAIVLADFWWQPPTMTDGQTSYTLIVWVDNEYHPTLGKPPSIDLYSIGSLGSDLPTVGNTVAGHFNLAMFEVTMTLPDAVATVQGISALPIPTASDKLWIGLQCNPSSAGGHFSFTVTGSSADNTIIVPKSDVGATGQMVLMLAAKYDGKVQPYINYNFYAPPNDPMGGDPLQPVAYKEGADGSLTKQILTRIR